jgi:hypothetical protein
MSAALACLDDDLQMPRRARHLYLVALDGHIVAPNKNRRPAACMRTRTSALLSDILDRAKSTTLPDGSTTTMEYGFDKDAFDTWRFQTIVTDANKNTKKSYRDVRELITSVVEENRSFDNAGKQVGRTKPK